MFIIPCTVHIENILHTSFLNFSHSYLVEESRPLSMEPSNNTDIHKSPMMCVTANGTAYTWEEMGGCLQGEAKLAHGRKEEEDIEVNPVRREKQRAWLPWECSAVL